VISRVLLLGLLCCAGGEAQILVTISPQQAPFPLSPGLQLFSAVGCSAATESRNRTVTAAQIRQIAEAGGVSFQDPALNSPVITGAVARSPHSRVLNALQYFADGLAVGGAVVTAFKSSQPNVGNAKTWGIITAGGGSLATGIPIAESIAQSKVASVATITNGVAAALMADMTALYTVPAGGGCMKSVMFFGFGATGVKSGTLP
jgi:hypothetical protein